MSMEWETTYAVSRSLALAISRRGEFLGSVSLSREPQALQQDAIPVLLGFAAGATPRDVFDKLRQEWEVEEEGFAEVVASLIAQSFLTPQGAAAPALAEGGFASVYSHHVMLRDSVRVQAYRSAILRQCAGKRVVEIGCGTGILSIFAAQAGATRVTAIEESRIADLAVKMFAANGVADRIELKLGNSRDVAIGEPADVVVHEILGSDPFSESILPVIADARRFLAPGGRFLPYRLEVACRGIDLGEEMPRQQQQRLAEARELSRLYGVRMEPYVEALGGMELQWAMPRTLVSTDGSSFKPVVLSEECVLCDLDFQRDELETPALPPRLELPVHTAGTLSGVVLYFRAHLDEAVCLSTAPSAPTTHWGWDVRPLARALAVQPGETVPVRAWLRSSLGRQGLAFELA
jgi:protein arginine N-methyltransferase 1